MTAREYLKTLNDHDLIKTIRWHSLPYLEYQEKYGDHNEFRRSVVMRIESMEDAFDALCGLADRLERAGK
jgi:hypothetical protein